jgi:hypothetical protein
VEVGVAREIANERAGDAVNLPDGLHGVTADWLNRALGVRYSNVDVGDVAVSQVRQGSNTTARLALTYRTNGAGLPATMWVKGTWTGRGYGGLMPEARFYQEVAPRLSVHRPAVYYAGVDPAGSGHAALLLEDLSVRAVRFGVAGDSVTPDQVANLLDMLAELHALDWGSPSLRDSDWLAPRFRHDDPSRDEGIFGSFQPGWWDRQIVRPRAASVPEVLRNRLVVKQALINLYAAEDEPGSPEVLVHGDMHLGNTFFETDGRPGILDWPCGVGHWGHDVTYGIISWLSIEARRAHDRSLFDHYLERVVAHGGPALDRDHAWLQWRQHIIHGFMWVMCSPRQQPEDLIVDQTARFCAAAVDHDMLGALGVSAIS